MLVAGDSAEFLDWLDDDQGGGRGAGGRGDVVGRQSGVVAFVQVAADAVADRELPDEVVLTPAEPLRLDVARDAAAIAEEAAVDEMTVVERQVAADQLEVDMAPGL